MEYGEIIFLRISKRTKNNSYLKLNKKTKIIAQKFCVF